MTDGKEPIVFRIVEGLVLNLLFIIILVLMIANSLWEWLVSLGKNHH